MIGYSATEEPPQRQRAAFGPENPESLPGEHGHLPIGSICSAEQLRIGRVVQTHSEAPLRPAVELIIDEYGNKLGEREVIEPVGRKSLFIVKAVDPKSLALHKALSGVELPALPERNSRPRGKRYPERTGISKIRERRQNDTSRHLNSAVRAPSAKMPRPPTSSRRMEGACENFRVRVGRSTWLFSAGRHGGVCRGEIVEDRSARRPRSAVGPRKRYPDRAGARLSSQSEDRPRDGLSASMSSSSGRGEQHRASPQRSMKRGSTDGADSQEDRPQEARPRLLR